MLHVFVDDPFPPPVALAFLFPEDRASPPLIALEYQAGGHGTGEK